MQSLVNQTIAEDLDSHDAILDGEIVCLDGDGKSQFRDLLFRRGEPRFIAFDLLWLDGTDLRFLSLADRKQELKRLIPRVRDQLLYCDHVEADGEGLFRLACENDLEGIVAKQKFEPYKPKSQWLKIRNRS